MGEYRLGFIGAGAMAEAIISGVIKSDLFQGADIIAGDINEDRLVQMQEEFGIVTTSDNSEVFKQAEIIVLAIKPQYLKKALVDLKDKPAENKIVISIVAGITIGFLEKYLGQIPIIRVMPNTPSLVGLGMAAISQGSFATTLQLETAEEIFKAVGETVVVPENLIDAVTGLSGSGPAYVYQFIEALADGGVLAGLPRNTAYLLATQTVIGAGEMVRKTGLHPGELKDRVTSPGGTTINGIKALEKAGFRAAVMDAVEASYLKSKQMSQED